MEKENGRFVLLNFANVAAVSTADCIILRLIFSVLVHFYRATTGTIIQTYILLSVTFYVFVVKYII